MELDAAELHALEIYGLMTSLIVPRPIAWVGSRSPEGTDNLAPFSYFMGVSSRPPALAISVARKKGGLLKDTARNILETGVFTVSSVPAGLAAPMSACSAELPAVESEFTHAGLTSLSGRVVAAPYPAEAPTVMECRLIHHHDMGATHLLVGEVLRFHLDETIIRRDAMGRLVVDPAALDPLARLGGADYARLQPPFTLPRP